MFIPHQMKKHISLPDPIERSTHDPVPGIETEMHSSSHSRKKWETGRSRSPSQTRKRKHESRSHSRSNARKRQTDSRSHSRDVYTNKYYQS